MYISQPDVRSILKDQRIYFSTSIGKRIYAGRPSGIRILRCPPVKNLLGQAVSSEIGGVHAFNDIDVEQVGALLTLDEKIQLKPFIGKTVLYAEGKVGKRIADNGLISRRNGIITIDIPEDGIPWLGIGLG